MCSYAELQEIKQRDLIKCRARAYLLLFLHYPRLDTVIMVEETIKKLDYYPTKTQLWKELPRRSCTRHF